MTRTSLSQHFEESCGATVFARQDLMCVLAKVSTIKLVSFLLSELF